MTDTERIEKITKSMQDLRISEMTRDELIDEVHNMTINEIDDFVYDMYHFVSDICDTLNM